ncbi:hypothetical protein F4815DRAFT_215755 [Daldinia loculata]|nr:hypothetical protein F4815DRAFT_215755 [Daldinia loculata]
MFCISIFLTFNLQDRSFPVSFEMDSLNISFSPERCADLHNRLLAKSIEHLPRTCCGCINAVYISAEFLTRAQRPKFSFMRRELVLLRRNHSPLYTQRRHPGRRARRVGWGTSETRIGLLPYSPASTQFLTMSAMIRTCTLTSSIATGASGSSRLIARAGCT